MNYKIINRDLRIASCKLKDLTIKEMLNILDMHSNHTYMSECIYFFDDVCGYIVFIEDSYEHSNYAQIVENYLSQEKEEREKMLEKVSENGKVALRYMEHFSEKNKDRNILPFNYANRRSV